MSAPRAGHGVSEQGQVSFVVRGLAGAVVGGAVPWVRPFDRVGSVPAGDGHRRWLRR